MHNIATVNTIVINETNKMTKMPFTPKRLILVAPITAIFGAAFLPLQGLGQQALVLFALLWFNVFILFDVLGK